MEEAGPSSAGNIDEQRREKPASGKQSEGSEVGEYDVDDKGGFTPGPLLSLKEQIEKDKVSLSFSNLHFGVDGCVFKGCFLVSFYFMIWLLIVYSMILVWKYRETMELILLLLIY